MSDKKKTENKPAAKKRGLGRGLSALIGTDQELSEALEQVSEQEDRSRSIMELDIRMVEPDAAQPRKSFGEEALEEMADSIRQYGVIQPLIVQKMDEDRYQIIAGERRWRAAKKAGLEKIPAILKDHAPEEVLEISLIENIQRENLNPVEEAKAYRRLIDEYKLKQDEVAKRVGKNRTTITNSLRLLNLEDEVLAYLVSGELTTGHAKALLSVKGKERQRQLADKAVKEGLSVRKLEQLAQQPPKQIAIEEPISPAEEAVYKELTQRLRESLGTKVSIVRNPKKNKIEIEYYSEEELERLVEILTRG